MFFIRRSLQNYSSFFVLERSIIILMNSSKTKKKFPTFKILAALFILAVIVGFSSAMLGVGMGLGMILSDIPGVPKLQLIANKPVFNHDFDENGFSQPIAFPGCNNELANIINILRDHTDDELSETMARHLEEPTSTYFNWRMQMADGTPFYARYQTDGMYSMDIEDIKAEQLEKTVLQPLVADLQKEGFEFKLLGDIPTYGNADGSYTRRIAFSKKFKSVISGEEMEGRYILEAQEVLPLADASAEEKFKPRVSLTINCKEDADLENYKAYNQIYSWYANSAKNVEKDTLVGFDPSLSDDQMELSKSKLFAFEIGTPSKAWNDSPKEIWIKDGADKLKMIQELQSKPNCKLLAQNGITGVACVD